MKLLLYGVIGDKEFAPHPDQALMLIRAAGLAAVASWQESFDQDVDSVLAFGKVVAHIDRQATIVPMRYGNLLPDESAVSDHLLMRADDYRERLAELEGCVEMGVRLPVPQPRMPSCGENTALTGYEYLLVCKQRYMVMEQAEHEAAALDRALKGLYRKRCGESGFFAGRPMYSLSYLVPRMQLPDFRATLENFGDGGSDQRLISGPWPPYNFAAL